MGCESMFRNSIQSGDSSSPRKLASDEERVRVVSTVEFEATNSLITTGFDVTRIVALVTSLALSASSAWYVNPSVPSKASLGWYRNVPSGFRLTWPCSGRRTSPAESRSPSMSTSLANTPLSIGTSKAFPASAKYSSAFASGMSLTGRTRNWTSASSDSSVPSAGAITCKFQAMEVSRWQIAERTVGVQRPLAKCGGIDRGGERITVDVSVVREHSLSNVDNQWSVFGNVVNVWRCLGRASILRDSRLSMPRKR